MKIAARIVQRVMAALNVDYYTAEQLLRETNSAREAIDLGKKYLHR